MLKISDLYFFLSVAIVILSFFLGTYVLENLGIQYASEGGAFIFKIHLSSYVGLILFALFFMTVGVRGLIDNLGRLFKSWLFLVLSIVYLILYGLFKNGMSGMAYTVDTLLLPMLVFSVLIGLDFEHKKKILSILTVLMLLNGFTAVFEYVRSVNVWPAEYMSYFYFRANGWMAHPLNNALIMSCVAPVLFKHRMVNPIFYFYITLLALFAFGGRTAAGIYVLFASFLLIYIAVEQYRFNKGFSVFGVVVFSTSLIFGILLVLYMILEMNIGSRIFENISLDASAQTRLDIFSIFSYLEPSEFMFGAKQDIFDDLFYYVEVKVVENYVIGWLLSFGLVGALPLIISFLVFLKQLYSYSDIYGKFSVLIFLFISITNNALSVKTVSFLFFLTILACNFYNRDEK